MQEESNTQNTSAEVIWAVNWVTIKPLPFWKGNTSTWFAQIKVEFALSKISSDTTKYCNVISAVDTEILTQVADIIQTPLSTDKYVTFKSRLIGIFTDSIEKKLRKLLNDAKLADKNLWALLNEMQPLGGMSLSVELLKFL